MESDDEKRRARYRTAMLERARVALRELEQQLDKPGGSRVIGNVDASGDPDSMTIRVEVPMGGVWVPLVEFRPSEIGYTEEDIAHEIQLLRHQSGVDIPGDISSLDAEDGENQGR
ncbi:hypothetical protein [Saccharothrix sp. ALI-22-I]|uniref:hypothetical protein n=1 Tax=Saccharothrix sp. ALI-22-I TaxID=1933778 RepID=UPI00117A3C69|nr:hypothetical protein [Saccharothrix sp. ALI-22-I]